ncbi:septation protein SepH [Aeromicrobium sp.]|uniref:septation protein SepH n=1 Tax=Aeromicrobium sp. TaxID=1871063 RepID=UPI0028B2526F|nr:septation protein SepH [Aeromicrobium sp.]
MRELATVGLSDDGRFLVARDATTGERFRLSIDRRLTSLVDRTPVASSRSGQMEIPMESSLTPRDIQIRIRRGESVEEVAEAAGITVERVHGFAVPVIAEREWMAQSARATSVRRKHVGGAAVALSDLADAALAERGIKPEDATWDAWRREDGRWTVQVDLEDGTAGFLYDPKSRYVIADDDAARSLVGDLATQDQHDMALADLVTDAPEAFGGTVADEDPIDTAPLVRSIKEARDRRAMEQAVFEEPAAEVVDDHEDQALEERVAVPDTPKPRKKHSRRSVPSWDEIMFGGSSD